MGQRNQVCIAISMEEPNTDINVNLPLKTLCRMLPNAPSYFALYRWATYGMSSKSGKLVKFETVRLTGGLGSSISKYQKFIDDLQD